MTAEQKGSELGGTYRADANWHFMDGLTAHGAEVFLRWLKDAKHAYPGCSGAQEDGTVTVYWHV